MYQDYEMQVEVKLIINMKVSAVSLEAADAKIKDIISRDIEIINDYPIHSNQSYIYSPRAELDSYQVRNYIAYTPKAITQEERDAVWDACYSRKDTEEEEEDYE